MIRRLCFVMLFFVFSGGAGGAEQAGLVTKAAKSSVAETAARLEKLVTDAGMTVFAVIDHAAAAQKAGLQMPPARVVVFGSPKGGTPMMLKAPTIAIDLPMKVLVWEDAAGKPWVSYNSMASLAVRHDLREMEKQVQGVDAMLAKMTSMLVE